MLRAKRQWLVPVLVLLALALAAFAWTQRSPQKPVQAPLGLFTSLPIVWAETPDLGAALAPDAPRHWAMAELGNYGPVRPLDVLTAESLAGLGRLVIAQPRILQPSENVVLDDWVKAGGHLLLLADPALTEESEFALGDPRRPQALAMLSPILTRWGLELKFDAEQEMTETQWRIDGARVPVKLPGYFVPRPGSSCTVKGEGLLVRCRIGKGTVTALADAAVLEREDADGSRQAALGMLLSQAFRAD